MGMFSKTSKKSKSGKWMDGDFWDDEIENLRKVYSEIRDVRSETSGSTMGEHYRLVMILRSMGVDDEFEASSQVENYIEHILTTGKKPSAY